MAKLFLEIKNQTLTVRSDIERIVENSINYLEYEFNTTPDWVGLSKVVIVTYNKGKDSESHSEGQIKNQVIRAPGFSITVIGSGTVVDPVSGATKQIKIPTNEVFVTVYPSGPLTGDDNPSEEPLPGFGERMERAEAEINAIKKIIPAEGELDAIRKKNQEIEDNFKTINNSISKNRQYIADNAANIEKVQVSVEKTEKNLTNLKESIQEDFDEVNGSIRDTNSNLETLSQKVDGMKIVSKVENNVLYIYYENTIE